VTLGSNRRGRTLEVAGLGLDRYGPHWYDHFGSLEPFPFLPCPAQLDGPCFMGEAPTAGTARTARELIAASQAAGYEGLALWSSRGDDAFSEMPEALADLYLGEAPGLYPAVVTSGTLVTLSWTPSLRGPPATGYLLRAKLAPSGPVIASIPAPPTSTSLTVLAPRGLYYVDMQKVTAAGVTAVSNELAVVMGRPPVPSTPRDLVASVRDRIVRLDWDAPENAAVARPVTYLVDAGRGPSQGDLGSFPTGPVPGFVAADVPVGRYFVRVRAQNHSGTSAASNEVVVTIGLPAAGPPTDFTASLANGIVTLSWSPPATGAPVTGYQIQAGDRAGASNLARLDVPATPTRAQFAGVPRGTYYVRVMSIDALGPSAASNEVTLVVP
jgi:hypothetical protein